MNIQDIDREYIAGTYARVPVEIVSGAGSLVYDEAGKVASCYVGNTLTLERDSGGG